MLNETVEDIIDEWNEFVQMILSDESYTSKVIFSGLLLFIFFASLIGNFLTCIVIYYDKTMHTTTNFYLFNLAISDLLVTLPILISVYEVLSENSNLVEFLNGGISCKFVYCIHFIFVNLLWNNGILVMTALSIERYIAICYPMKLSGKPVWKRVGKIIVLIWVIAIFETMPQLWTFDVIEIDKGLKCFWLPTQQTRFITGILASFTFVIPLVILIFVYTMIAYRVNENLKYDLKHTTCKNGYKRKSVNKLIALTVSFVVCWLPYFLVRMIMFITEAHYLKFYTYFGIIHKIAMLNGWFTTVLNPILFSVMSIKFRKALKILWERKIKKNYQANKTIVTDTQTKIQHLVI